MIRVKYTTNTVYITEPEQWDEIKNSPATIAQEMYNDLLMANSGALMLYEHLALWVSDTISNSVTVLYPKADKSAVCVELYKLLRSGSREVTFNGTFRFSIEDVETNQEDMIGLKIKFLRK